MLPYAVQTYKPLSAYLRRRGFNVRFWPLPSLRGKLYYKTENVRKETGQQTGVVYALKCAEPGCGSHYVGQTGRKLSTRVKEHVQNRNGTSALGNHCREFGHTIDEQAVRVLDKAPNYFDRLRKETLFIQSNQDALVNGNAASTSLSNGWMQLQEHFRL